MTDRDRKRVVVGRLRAAPRVGWQFACAVLLGVLVARLEWGGDPVGALRYLVFGQPLLLLGIVAVLGVWGYVFGLWRRRRDYLRQDGVTLYREYGRAPGCERVCQSVWFSEVAGE